MATDDPRFIQFGNALGWCLVPLAGLMQLVGLRRPVPGLEWPSVELVGFTLILLATLPWSWRRRAEVSRWGWLLTGSFAALIGYGLLTILLNPRPKATTSEIFDVSQLCVVLPLLTALATMGAAVGLVLTAEARLRPTIIATACAVLSVTALISWPRQAVIHRSERLATAMAGSATVHVVLLLVAAFTFGLFLDKWHPRVSLVLGGLATLGLLATESRAGMLALVTWIVLSVVGRALVGRAHVLKLWPLWAVCGILAVALLAFGPFGRMVSFADPKRAENLETALRIWTRSSETVALGTGAGQVWPWYAFDSGAVPIPGDGIQNTAWGDVLISPHSTVLAVVVELGLVGAVLGVACIIALVGALWSSRKSPSRSLLAAALAASCVAFLFDTYLVKNFGVSLWWWLFATVVMTRNPSDPELGLAGQTILPARAQ